MVTDPISLNSKPEVNNEPILETRAYDAKALLSPKAASRKPKKSPSPYMASVLSRDGSPEGMDTISSPQKSSEHTYEDGRRSMLEGLYGVERRTEQPRKRVKTSSDANGEDDAANKAKATFHHRSNGIIGKYMKPDKDLPPAGLVDLTNDDDDDEDDLQVTGSRQVEVCFGLVEATVLAYVTPRPKTTSKFTSPNEWPLMRCDLSRGSSATDNTIIEVIDPCGKPFGRINSALAVVLAPAMDGLQKFRPQARLLNRRKKIGGDEWPHQPCSDQMRMIINMYGLKGDAQKIGKLFGQHNIWIRPPMAADPGYDLCNPHAPKKGGPLLYRSDSGGRKIAVGENRTIEEATEAVSKLFDHFASQSTLLKSTEAPDTVLTPLLEHQKQALTFLLQHEKARLFGTEEADNTSLWRVKQKANGKKVYREVVSGLTLEDEPEQVYGGLLADVMGLGKTLEALALVATTLEEAAAFSQEKLVRSKPEDAVFKSHTRGTLLVCPLSTIKNWEDQISEHIKPGVLSYHVYHGPNRESNVHKLSRYDITITTYGTVAAEFSGKSNKDVSPLRQLKWFRIILDEAHTIREPRATQSQAMYTLWAQRRWCLTGTPIQNRIDDLGSLTRFLKLYPYDNAARFNQYIRAPAQAGDPSFLKGLRVFVDSFTLRRLKDRVDLPNRQDLIEQLQFSPDEKKLHDFFREIAHIQIEELAKKKDKKSGVQHHVLQGIMTLRLICAHGRELLKKKDLDLLKGISASEAIDLDEVQEAPTRTKREAYEALSLMAEAGLDLCRNCDKPLGSDSPAAEAEDSQSGVRCLVLPCYDVVCNDCFEPYKKSFDSRPSTELVTCPFCSMSVGSQYVPITSATAQELETAPDDAPPTTEKPEQDAEYYGAPHTKTMMLLRDIEEMNKASEPLVAQGEPPIKCVVFSEFTSHLNLIERALTDKGHTFVRIDGSMTLNKRKKVLDALSTDDGVTILLASIKAAGQGLNLTAASQAFIMEPMWNPAAEAQAVDRIYRIGQKREVIIKRYQMADSIEGKIVELQKRKQALADVSMNQNHKQLSKQEVREQHMKDILALFK